jgi:hypothetical protein
MANVRRGGLAGLPAQELRVTLGALLKSTIAQAGVVRDVLERGAREGRTRLEDALANRRRNETFAKLGEIIFDLIQRGEIDVNELPEVRDLVARLEENRDASEPAPVVHPVSRPASFSARRDQAADDDEDLSEYMHPDDVPARDRT